MKSSIKKQITSSKATSIGYVLAILLAIQPLLNMDIDFTKRIEVIKYLVRLVFAAAVAFVGKYATEHKLVKKE